MSEAEPGLRVEPFCLGPLQTNCYVLVRPGGKAWVFDPGMEPQPLLDRIEEAGWQVQAIWLTHAHYDHIGGVHAVRSRFAPECPVLIHAAEKRLSGCTGKESFAVFRHADVCARTYGRAR